MNNTPWRNEETQQPSLHRYSVEDFDGDHDHVVCSDQAGGHVAIPGE